MAKSIAHRLSFDINTFDFVAYTRQLWKKQHSLRMAICFLFGFCRIYPFAVSCLSSRSKKEAPQKELESLYVFPFIKFFATLSVDSYIIGFSWAILVYWFPKDASLEYTLQTVQASILYVGFILLLIAALILEIFYLYKIRKSYKQ